MKKADEKPDVVKNFFLMFRSNGKLLSLGDAFRIRKYYKLFKSWDGAINTNPLFSIYPEFLTDTLMSETPTTFFLKEKEIIRNI